MVSSTDKFVLCKGTSGMGNRILAACTALLYGEITQRQVVIDWRDQSYSEQGENAFPRFFDCPSALAVEQLPHTDSIYPAVWTNRLTEDLGSLQRQLKLKVDEDMSFDLSQAAYPEEILVFCAYTHKINTLRPFFQGEYAFLATMKTPEILRYILTSKLYLVESINAAIQTFKSEFFVGNMIGVHVRYTDIKVPLEKVIDKVRRVQKEHPDSNIFLATDSQTVVEHFTSQFPDLVTTYKWFPPAGERMHQNWSHCPNRFENGVEALTDLFLLAECDRLIFSSRSSFGYVASLLSQASPDRIFDIELSHTWLKQFKHQVKTLYTLLPTIKMTRAIEHWG